MTGFGKATARIGGKTIDVEIRSLNSKQLDLNLRMPYIYHEIEAEIRSMVGAALDRGKVDVSINISGSEDKGKAVLNRDLAKEYYKELRKLSKEIGEKNDQYLPMVLRMPDVFKSEVVVDKKELKTVTGLVAKALQLVKGFREKEGAALKKDIELHLANIEHRETEVAKLDLQRIEKLRDRVQAKINELLDKSKIDQNRFEQEMIYYVEKLDINEERTRLRTHCNYFRECSKEKNGGRKLGFIVQEIGREINTIGSKANDADIQKVVVNMKDELEKIKEQLLNVL
jgi:uncharacterized protein (TIGR00255 family)